MNDLTQLQPQQYQWADAVYKKRWIEITVRYDDLSRFISNFVIPLTRQLTRENVIFSFYHNLVTECDALIQLHFKTTQYNTSKYFIPYLYSALNKYFDPAFLAQFNMEAISEASLEKKAGYARYNWKQFKILGIEEFSFNRFPFRKSTYGKDELAELLTASAHLIMEDWNDPSAKDRTNDLTERSLRFLLPVIRAFMDDQNEIQRFCDWLIAVAQDLINENISTANPQCVYAKNDASRQENTIAMNFPPDLLNRNRYDVIQEKNSDNSWINHVSTFKSKLDVLAGQNLLHIWEFKKDPLEIQYLGDLDKETEMKWLVTTYLCDTIPGQLGMRANGKYHLYNCMKKLLLL